ncbi:hypothetical protein Ate01nite_20220 [Actinoplanes teichomyceticus]|nr:hypothetical protein Ate01nite_20220 [Actinoplanes teichomyceticus]
MEQTVSPAVPRSTTSAAGATTPLVPPERARLAAAPPTRDAGFGAAPAVRAGFRGVPGVSAVGGLVAAPLETSRATAFAAMFKALGDPVRLRLLSMIASAPAGEICVCDLSGAFHLTGPTISHHLRILREAGLVDSDRRGTWVYYRAVPATLILLAGLLHTPA